MKHEHMVLFRLSQVWALCMLAVAYIVSLFYKKKRIWLMSERGVDARDNGYWFFRYLKDNHPEEDVYYVITKDSVDRHRLIEYESSLLDFRSLKHYIMLWRASYLISTHLHGYFPYGGLGAWLKGVFPAYRQKKHINIKHGITINYTNVLDYKFAKWDLIIAGAKPEYEFFIKRNGYPSNHVALTGHARYDQLNNNSPKRQLLLMPTWREWIFKDKGFEKTQYAQRYASLIQSKDLHQLLEAEDINLIFYPHHEIQRYLDFFRNLEVGKHIIIADKRNYDVQQLLKDSALLITDYSSVAFDFAYMRKPILYYQFDYEQFRSEHYQEGWFSYQDSFADVFNNEKDMIDAIRKYIDSGFSLKIEHRKYIDHLFPYNDSGNCERIYNTIIERL